MDIFNKELSRQIREFIKLIETRSHISEEIKRTWVREMDQILEEYEKFLAAFKAAKEDITKFKKGTKERKNALDRLYRREEKLYKSDRLLTRQLNGPTEIVSFLLYVQCGGLIDEDHIEKEIRKWEIHDFEIECDEFRELMISKIKGGYLRDRLEIYDGRVKRYRNAWAAKVKKEPGWEEQLRRAEWWLNIFHFKTEFFERFWFSQSLRKKIL